MPLNHPLTKTDSTKLPKLPDQQEPRLCLRTLMLHFPDYSSTFSSSLPFSLAMTCNEEGGSFSADRRMSLGSPLIGQKACLAFRPRRGPSVTQHCKSSARALSRSSGLSLRAECLFIVLPLSPPSPLTLMRMLCPIPTSVLSTSVPFVLSPPCYIKDVLYRFGAAIDLMKMQQIPKVERTGGKRVTETQAAKERKRRRGSAMGEANCDALNES